MAGGGGALCSRWAVRLLGRAERAAVEYGALPRSGEFMREVLRGWPGVGAGRHSSMAVVHALVVDAAPALLASLESSSPSAERTCGGGVAR